MNVKTRSKKTYSVNAKSADYGFNVKTGFCRVIKNFEYFES